MFDLSKSFSHPLAPLRVALFCLPLRLFRGSSSRLCLVLSDIDHSNTSSLILPPSLDTPSTVHPMPRCSLFASRQPRQSWQHEAPKCRFPPLFPPFVPAWMFVKTREHVEPSCNSRRRTECIVHVPPEKSNPYRERDTIISAPESERPDHPVASTGGTSRSRHGCSFLSFRSL